MPRTPLTAATLAVVDMGSNSFRLEIGRVEGDQIYRLDTWRETLRMGAGIDARVNKLGPFGHTVNDAVIAAIREQWKWLVRDDARWSPWLAR